MFDPMSQFKTVCWMPDSSLIRIKQWFKELNIYLLKKKKSDAIQKFKNTPKIATCILAHIYWAHLTMKAEEHFDLTLHL